MIIISFICGLDGTLIPNIVPLQYDKLPTHPHFSVVQEEEALRNEVVELHDQVLAHEVESGNQKKEIDDLKERNENLEFMLNVSFTQFCDPLMG